MGSKDKLDTIMSELENMGTLLHPGVVGVNDEQSRWVCGEAEWDHAVREAAIALEQGYVSTLAGAYEELCCHVSAVYATHIEGDPAALCKWLSDLEVSEMVADIVLDWVGLELV
jgi:hypothetical protein